MKFRCVEGHDFKNRSWFDWRKVAVPVDGLTELKVYRGLISIDYGSVLIFNDDNEWAYYRLDRFVPVED